MADIAREEADRYLNSGSLRERLTSHPEDRESLTDEVSETDEKATTEPAFGPSINSSNNIDDDDSDNDEDLSRNMSTLTTSRATYQVPATLSYANTGPKGVIADAQNFARARQSTFRKTLSNIANNLSHKSTIPGLSQDKPSRSGGTGAALDRQNSSDENIEDDDRLKDVDDEDFMAQWRESRLKELQNQSQSLSIHQQQQQQNANSRRTSPSRRHFGTVAHVNATGYLDAVEHSSPSTTVVVLLFDPTHRSAKSQQAEYLLDYLAAKYTYVKFVKLDYDIAEMEYLVCPSVIGYRAGDVVGTVSGVDSTIHPRSGATFISTNEQEDEDDNDSNAETELERELIKQGVL